MRSLFYCSIYRISFHLQIWTQLSLRSLWTNLRRFLDQQWCSPFDSDLKVTALFLHLLLSLPVRLFILFNRFSLSQEIKSRWILFSCWIVEYILVMIVSWCVEIVLRFIQSFNRFRCLQRATKWLQLSMTLTRLQINQVSLSSCFHGLSNPQRGLGQGMRFSLKLWIKVIATILWQSMDIGQIWRGPGKRIWTTHSLDVQLTGCKHVVLALGHHVSAFINDANFFQISSCRILGEEVLQMPVTQGIVRQG